MNKILFYIFAICFACSGALYSSEIEFPYGAGLAALNGAVIALPREDSVSFNPSSLALLDRKTLLLSGTQSVADRKTMQVFGVLPMKKFGFAAGFSKTSFGAIEIKDELNNSLGATEFYSQKISAYTGFRYGKILALGGGINFVSVGLENETFESKSLFDFGMLGYLRQWNVGVSLLNWGDNKSGAARIGIAKEGKATYSMEGIWPLSQSPYIAFSLDYQIYENFSCRGVYHAGPQDITRFGPVSGFGVGFRLDYKHLSFDYAILPEGNIGLSHKFAVVWKSKNRIEKDWRLEPILDEKKKKKFYFLRDKKAEDGESPMATTISSEMSLQDAYPHKPQEGDTEWNALTLEAKSYFAVIHQEVDIKESGDSLTFNLKNVACKGRSSFSEQSGNILGRVAEFLSRYGQYPILIHVSGDREEEGCHEAVKTFLFNKKVDAKITATFSVEEPSTRIVLMKFNPDLSK